MVLPALGHSKTSWGLDVDYVLVLDHIFILARSLDNCEDISLISSDIYLQPLRNNSNHILGVDGSKRVLFNPQLV